MQCGVVGRTIGRARYWPPTYYIYKKRRLQCVFWLLHNASRRRRRHQRDRCTRDDDDGHLALYALTADQQFSLGDYYPTIWDRGYIACVCVCVVGFWCVCKLCDIFVIHGGSGLLMCPQPQITRRSLFFNVNIYVYWDCSEYYKQPRHP